jgi:hypothetical protein
MKGRPLGRTAMSAKELTRVEVLARIEAYGVSLAL